MTGAPLGIIAVTGATGFIGRNLCRHLQRRGWRVRALVRDPSAGDWAAHGASAFACDLPDTIDPAALRGTDAVIHCAYVTRHRNLAESRRVNEAGTIRLIELCRAAGVPRFVFISSQSAHDGALSYYGRSKRALERQLAAGTDLIIRPGLVLGPGDAGLFARMCETLSSSRVIPLFGGGRQPLQTVHIDDLCQAVLAALDRGLAGTFTIAEPEPIPMRDFLAAVAGRLGRRPFFVPLPLGPSLAAFRAIEMLHVRLPVTSENLLGLKQMRADETLSDLAALDISARPALESLDAIFGAAP